MKLSDVMIRDVEIIQPDDSLQLAAKKMKDRNIDFLPVCDGSELLGVLSDRDLTIRALAEGIDVNVMLSRDLMTTPAIFCFEDQDVSEAEKVMHANEVNQLVIVSREDNRVVGVVSLKDLTRDRAPDA